MSEDIKSSDRAATRPTTTTSAVREFIVEFLGGLVPGIAFLIAIVPAFFIPLAGAALSVLPFPNWLTQLTVKGSVSPSVSTIMFLLFPLLMGFFVFAYIAGHLFYRQDPKKVDEASFKRISREFKNNKNMMAREITSTNGVKETPVEFPYHFLRKYLEERGINYLAVRVPWNETDHARRAKHFANALKLRIQMSSAEAGGILASNEAHVRLSSSMWYVCRLISGASMIGFSIFVIVASISRCVLSHPRLAAYFQPYFHLNFSFVLFLPCVTCISARLTEIAIERALHYQRAREILFILELAHWLAITGRSPNIFSGLEADGASNH